MLHSNYLKLLKLQVGRAWRPNGAVISQDEFKTGLLSACSFYDGLQLYLKRISSGRVVMELECLGLERRALALTVDYFCQSLCL